MLCPCIGPIESQTHWVYKLDDDDVTHFNDDVSPGGWHAGVLEGSTGVQLAARIVMLSAGLRLARLCPRSVGVENHSL
jgi:hypothetical protein